MLKQEKTINAKDYKNQVQTTVIIRVIVISRRTDNYIWRLFIKFLDEKVGFSVNVTTVQVVLTEQADRLRRDCEAVWLRFL
jgi:hypothetical protein